MADEPELRLGAENDQSWVAYLQQMLNYHANAGLAEDGLFGPGTSAALAAWQQQLGLASEPGVADQATWRALIDGPGAAGEGTGEGTGEEATKEPEQLELQLELGEDGKVVARYGNPRRAVAEQSQAILLQTLWPDGNDAYSYGGTIFWPPSGVGQPGDWGQTDWDIDIEFHGPGERYKLRLGQLMDDDWTFHVVEFDITADKKVELR